MQFAQKILSLALALALCITPEMLRAQETGSPNQTAPAPSAPASQPNVNPPTQQNLNQTAPVAAPDQNAAAQNPDQSAQPAQTNGTEVNPAQAPLAPAESPNTQQAAPEEAPVQEQQPAAQTPAAQNAPAAAQNAPNAPQPQNQPTEPSGTAAAQKGRTVGGAASQPAGTAIAPAKQNQRRSLLIKIGLIAAAGVAAGTVYALSRHTPSTPPGTSANTVTAPH